MKYLNHRAIRVLLLTILLYAIGSYFVHNKHLGCYIASDSEGYYLYIPAVFHYGTFENIPTLTPGQFQAYPGTNKVLTRFTYGIALLELPFYGLAQLSRYIQHLPLDQPHSGDVSVALLLGGCFYTSLGVMALYRVLRNATFSKKVSLFSILILLLGTNLFYYTVTYPTMSHNYLFCLLSLLLYFIPDYYKDASRKKAAIIGFLLGLAMLIRPTNIIFYLVFFLYDVKNMDDLQARWKHFGEHFSTLLIFALMGIMLFIPQCYYWYYLSGSIILYSYDKIGFMYLTSPKLWQIFFHFCNGFLIYTPLMLAAIVGIFQTAYRNVHQGRITLFIFMMMSYIFASWQAWWFGSSYGYRSFIDFYPLFAFGLAYSIAHILEQKKWLQYGFLSIAILLVFINIRFSMLQYMTMHIPDHDAWLADKNYQDFMKCLADVFFKW